MHAVKDQIRRFLRSRGQVLMPLWRLESWPWEEHLTDLLDKYRVDCVLDVGANLGQFHDHLRDIGYNGPVISFEPVSTFYQELCRKAARDPSWRVFPYALGSEHGEKTIHVFASPGLSSILEPDDAAMQSLLPAPDRARIERTETIQVRRLDEVLDDLTHDLDSRRIFLKIDTQGYDLEVIRGATASLGRVAALQTEVSMIPIYQHMPDYASVITELKSLGFDISGMFPVTRDDGLRVIEFDCVMVRRALSS